jgi:hypothetical protein
VPALGCPVTGVRYQGAARVRAAACPDCMILGWHRLSGWPWADDFPQWSDPPPIKAQEPMGQHRKPKHRLPSGQQAECHTRDRYAVAA